MEQLFGLRKGAWTEEEDLLLRKCIQKYGEGKWRHVPVRAGLRRCRKSCRLRWLNYLRPNIKRGEFTQDEVDLISRLHKLLGNRWSLIAGRLPGRTANDIKNYWNTRTNKNLGSKVGEVKDKVRIEKIKDIRPQPWTFSKNSPGWRRLSSSISVDTTTTTTAINTTQSREIVLGTASPSLPPEDPTLWWGDVFVEKEGAKGTSCSFSGSGRGKSLWIDDVEPATKCGEASSKEAKGGWDDFFWVEDVDPMMKGEETLMEEGKNDWDDFGSEFNIWDSFGEEGEVVFIV